MNKFQMYFPHAVVVTLISLAGISHSVGFAYAAVLALGLNLAYGAFQQIEASKTYKSQLPEDIKRQLHDLNARLVTIEHGIRSRGF